MIVLTFKKIGQHTSNINLHCTFGYVVSDSLIVGCWLLYKIDNQTSSCKRRRNSVVMWKSCCSCIVWSRWQAVSPQPCWRSTVIPWYRHHALWFLHHWHSVCICFWLWSKSHIWRRGSNRQRMQISTKHLSAAVYVLLYFTSVLL